MSCNGTNRTCFSCAKKYSCSAYMVYLLEQINKETDHSDVINAIAIGTDSINANNEAKTVNNESNIVNIIGNNVIELKNLISYNFNELNHYHKELDNKLDFITSCSIDCSKLDKIIGKINLPESQDKVVYDLDKTLMDNDFENFYLLKLEDTKEMSENKTVVLKYDTLEHAFENKKGKNIVLSNLQVGIWYIIKNNNGVIRLINSYIEPSIQRARMEYSGNQINDVRFEIPVMNPLDNTKMATLTNEGPESGVLLKEKRNPITGKISWVEDKSKK